MYKREEVLGLSCEHVLPIVRQIKKSQAIEIHKDLVKPLSLIQVDAKKAGFDMQVASGFRNFSRQLAIWNQKASGERPVLDSNECAININALADIDRVKAILHWTALPGASRHHWGCDIDVFDAKALKGSQLQLTVKECQTVFLPFYEWLDQYLAEQKDFFRPYNGDAMTGGVIACEPWHLSYRPVALKYQDYLTESVLEQFYWSSSASESLELKQTVLSYLPTIYRRYIECYFI